MTAIFETGGKQYTAEVGTVLYVEKLNSEADSEVVFDKVLMANGVVGRPYVSGAQVKAKVLKNGKSKKIRIFKYNQKKNYHRTQGHRQPYTKIEITSIK